ncbi:MAG TPA: DUF3298 domain-containing protein [Bacillota bacterium]|nr:DUF3298 domain-containing protein [Bacillota bacterium]
MVVQSLPVSIQTYMISHQGIMIYFPQIKGLTDEFIQQTINQSIYRATLNLIQRQHVEQDVAVFAEMLGMYEIKTNERSVLSLVLTNYAIASNYANGLTRFEAMTFDLTSGKQYELNDLFQPESDYVHQLSAHIRQQLSERDIPVLNSFEAIQPDQDFYIADKTIVLFFQPLTITPHYVGAPMFPIPIYKLESIIPHDGLLARLAAS